MSGLSVAGAKSRGSSPSALPSSRWSRWLAAQMEYRLQVLAWLGAVAFFGVGEVEPDLGSLNFKDLLPAGGLGARITVAKQNHINARVDVAFSKQGVSFAVGEAF